MVNICHVSSVHSRSDVRIFHKECVSLAQAGYNVTLLIADGKPDQERDGIIVIGCRKHRSRLSRMLFTPLTLFFKAIAERADIYHIHDPELIPLGLCFRIMGKAVIQDVHDDLPKQIADKHYIKKQYRQFLSASMSAFESLTLRFFSAIVIAVPFMQTRFAKINPRVRVICNFPLLSEFGTVSPDRKQFNTVCYVGGITKVRGIIELVKAMEHTDARLLLAGSFDPPTLLDEVKGLSGWSKVEYRGFLDREGIIDLLSEANIGIVTMHPNANYLDSIPIKMLEYMGSGLAVIASDFPNWQTIFGKLNCVRFVDPLSPQDIAKAINDLISDTQSSQEMGKRGRSAILNGLNWESQTRVLLDLYQEISDESSLH